MTQTKIQSIQIPPVSREFVRELKKVFRPLKVKPGATKDEIMWSAAEQNMIEWIERHSTEKVVSGNPEELREAKQDKTSDGNWLRRALKRGNT